VSDTAVVAPARLRDDLLAAGLLVPTGVDGLYGRSAAFEDVAEAVGRLTARTAADLAPRALRFAPVLPRRVLEGSDYLRSFPDMTGAVSSFTGDDRAHARLVGLLDAGEDWTSELTPAAVALCSASCHPLYPTLPTAAPPGGHLIDLQGWCFRHEPSLDPARMQAFRQHEIVYVGDAVGAMAHRDRWVERGLAMLRSLGLAVEPVVASDPFFGRLGRALAHAQQDENLKIELVVAITVGALTAVASSNAHRDHFGLAFGLRSSEGEVAHSACVGIGLERTTLALLVTHGLDPQRWSPAVRSLLWP